MLTALLPIFCLLAGATSKDLIVHMFEWRFDDIAQECREFLPQHGYTAVQTSPVSECAVIGNRPWWERYQPVSLRIISRSGNEDQMRQMVETCNNNGIKVYVDVIPNHMSADQPPGTRGTGGAVPDTRGKRYPDVPFGPEHFHQSCRVSDWNNVWQIRNCELEGLHDLNQGHEHVRSKYVEFLNKMVDMGVAGFRVDAAKHMEVGDLANIYGRVHNLNTRWFPQGSRPFFYQEIADGNNGVIKARDYFGIGAAMDFKYGEDIKAAFVGGNPLKYYRTFGESWGLLPWRNSVVFVDNHDTQRHDALTHKQPQQYRRGVAFMLAWPYSTARVMSSYSFNDINQGPPNNNGEISRVIRGDGGCSGGWICEHRWREIAGMAEFSKTVGDSPVQNWWDNGNNAIAFCRGDRGCAVFNNEWGDINVDLQTSLPPGEYCDVASGRKENGWCTGKTVTVRGDRKAQINVSSSIGFLAIHAGSKVR